MPKSVKRADSNGLRQGLVGQLQRYESELTKRSLKNKVLALIPAFRNIRFLGASLIKGENTGRKRVLYYLQHHPKSIIKADELMVVSGIYDWPRRLRELRVQFGYNIMSGATAKAMASEGDLIILGVDFESMKPNDYIMVNDRPDRKAARRWRIANGIRRRKGLVAKERILFFLKANVGKIVTGEEMNYVAKGEADWPRRSRELRTQEGWQVYTRNQGRIDIPPGSYLLESERRLPEHDRTIPDEVRAAVLERDKWTCQDCGWNRAKENRDDPRHNLELHHKVQHKDKGSNENPNNLITLCNVCHDKKHRK